MRTDDVVASLALGSVTLAHVTFDTKRICARIDGYLWRRKIPLLHGHGLAPTSILTPAAGPNTPSFIPAFCDTSRYVPGWKVAAMSAVLRASTRRLAAFCASGSASTKMPSSATPCETVSVPAGVQPAADNADATELAIRTLSGVLSLIRIPNVVPLSATIVWTNFSNRSPASDRGARRASIFIRSNRSCSAFSLASAARACASAICALAASASLASWAVSR